MQASLGTASAVISAESTSYRPMRIQLSRISSPAALDRLEAPVSFNNRSPHTVTFAMATESSEAPVKKKFQLKKPLFSKPSWASPKPISTNEDIFSRSNKSYAAIAEREEKHRRKREERKAKRLQEAVSDEDYDEHKDKKRRASVVDRDVSEDQDDYESSCSEVEEVNVGKLPTPRSRSPSKNIATPELPPISKQESSKSPTTQSQRPPPAQAEIIDIYDSADDSESTPAAPQRRVSLVVSDDDDIQITSINSKPPDPTVDEASDEEFAELARQAREKARRKRLNLDNPSQSSAGPSQSTLETSTLPNGSFVAKSETPQPPHDPEVSILITSSLPGTDMAIIKRRLNQRLRDVRIAWCSRQGFSDAETAKIILTFRGRRVFDVNTCKSLQIGVDATGEVVMEGEKDVLGEADRRIHMEAMTEVMYLEMEKQEEEKRGQQPEELDEVEVSEATIPKPPERETRIILKAQGLQDFKLRVKDVSPDYASRFLFVMLIIHSLPQSLTS